MFEVVVPELVEDILVKNIASLDSVGITRKELIMLCRSFFWQMVFSSIFFFSILALMRTSLFVLSCSSYCSFFYLRDVVVMFRLFIAVIIVDQFYEDFVSFDGSKNGRSRLTLKFMGILER